MILVLGFRSYEIRLGHVMQSLTIEIIKVQQGSTEFLFH